MTVTDVIRAAMQLTPTERARVVDMLLDAEGEVPEHVKQAWTGVAAERAEELDSGTVALVGRDDADAYLDSHTPTP